MYCSLSTKVSLSSKTDCTMGSQVENLCILQKIYWPFIGMTQILVYHINSLILLQHIKMINFEMCCDR